MSILANKVIINKKGIGCPVVVVVGGVHGDEPVGKKVIQTINKLKIVKGTLITIVANPIALLKRKRYIDSDLNRSFPGYSNGNREEKIAAILTPIIKKADYVLDIHSTTTNTGDAVITKKINKKTKKMFSILSPKRVVYMPKGFGDKSLINFCNGVSLEYGCHQDIQTYRKNLNSVLKFLFSQKIIKEKVIYSKNITEYYKVYGTELKPKKIIMNKKINNFELVKKDTLLGRVDKKEIFASEDFYPILFGPKAYPDIMGFKAKKIKI